MSKPITLPNGKIIIPKALSWVAVISFFTLAFANIFRFFLSLCFYAQMTCTHIDVR